MAAQDDLIALSDRLTDRDADVSIQDNRDAADEQRAALAAYERGTTALDAASRPKDMGAVSRAIAEGQYHLACADARADGQLLEGKHVHLLPRWHRGPHAGMAASNSCQHLEERAVEPVWRSDGLGLPSLAMRRRGVHDGATSDSAARSRVRRSRSQACSLSRR